MTSIGKYVIVCLVIVLAYWQKIRWLYIIAGIITIAFGLAIPTNNVLIDTGTIIIGAMTLLMAVL